MELLWFEISKLHLIATWTSPYKGILLFISKITEANSDKSNKIKS